MINKIYLLTYDEKDMSAINLVPKSMSFWTEIKSICCKIL